MCCFSILDWVSMLFCFSTKSIKNYRNTQIIGHFFLNLQDGCIWRRHSKVARSLWSSFESRKLSIARRAAYLLTCHGSLYLVPGRSILSPYSLWQSPGLTEQRTPIGFHLGYLWIIEESWCEGIDRKVGGGGGAFLSLQNTIQINSV